MRNRMKLESLFLIISIFFGIILAIIVPPFQSPDENNHFLKAYHLSKGEIYGINTSKDGYCISNNMSQFIDDMSSHMGDYDFKYKYFDHHIEQLLGDNYDTCTVRRISTDTVSPIAHLIPALGIQITDYIKPFENNEHISTTVMLQFARVMSVIVYSIICYYAIKLTTKFKKSMFIILLLPNSIYLRSTVSYDAIILSITALSLALIIKLFDDKKEVFDKKYIILFCLFGFILLSVKTLYSIVFLPLLFLSKEKFVKSKIKTYFFMVGIVGVLYLLFKLPYRNLPADLTSVEQISFVKNHIFYFFKTIVVNMYRDFRVQMHWMNGTIGLLDTYLPIIVVVLIDIVMVITILIDAFTEKNNLFSPIIKVLYSLLIVGVWFLSYTYMYIYWTPQVLGQIGGSVVTGVQGRYFLPLLLLLPVCLNNSLIKNKKIKSILNDFSNKIELVLPLFVIFQLFIMIFVILIRYY